MATSTTNAPRLDHLFSTSSARLDRWRELNANAQTWAADPRGNGRAAVEAALAEVRALEDFFAYPGPRLMKTLQERVAANDGAGVGRLVHSPNKRGSSVVRGSYRYARAEWETTDENAETAVPDRLPPARGERESFRPYFETLFVSSSPAANRSKIASEIRRLRRVDDSMIYEPVLVGSLEDALLATILNGKIEAVVIYDGLPLPSQHDVPLLRDFLTTYQGMDMSNVAPQETGVTLARLIKPHPPRSSTSIC